MYDIAMKPLHTEQSKPFSGKIEVFLNVNIWLALPFLHQHSDSREETEACEVQLIEAAKANPQDFTPLYERYALPVYRYLRTHTGNNEEAADLTQQTFLHALHALPRYHARGVPFAAWLFRIAHYTALQKQRKERITVSWDLLPEKCTRKKDRTLRKSCYTGNG